jgi:hypothetical protein
MGNPAWFTFFKCFNDEKLLSALAVVTGIVTNTFNNDFIIGKNSSQCF